MNDETERIEISAVFYTCIDMYPSFCEWVVGYLNAPHNILWSLLFGSIPAFLLTPIPIFHLVTGRKGDAGRFVSCDILAGVSFNPVKLN